MCIYHMSYIYTHYFTYVLIAAVAAVAVADYFASKVNQIEGRYANLQQSVNSARDVSCNDAPLSSRIDTVFDKLLTSRRFDTLYSLPTTSYQLLRMSLGDLLEDPLELWGVNSVVNFV